MDKIDSTILNRIREGDEKAFEELYHKYYETLCRFAAQLLHNSKIAEEVADDVFFHSKMFLLRTAYKSAIQV